eukprot:CAMPEP_0201547444 /NCGR_PEP_ID=MMETSP0173_2-20130828/3907_1 /ASSEMBLY_ACC=CAM_ASM_000268 /TAXON_ID=218659 /ORGANISM="Vexillifera sp., Strain DIVA3 564/2" /LENGTH=500 /DNA_ID=CAMNT_0047956493 /DNA_START=330 /DNA_END=1832 /DNA_ORIENTATION=+
MANGPHWCHTDLACLFNHFVSVGLMTNWPQKEIAYVVNNADLACVVCDQQTLPLFKTLTKEQCPTLEYLIVAGGDDNDDACCFKIVSYKDMEAPPSDLKQETYAGISLNSSIEDAQTKAIQRQEDDIVSLIYSSGSTGQPKGVIETEKRWNVQLSRAMFLNPHVVYSYAPLAHGMDRGMVWTSIANGGRVGFQSEPKRFLEDCQTLEPTIFISMPPLWNDLYAQYTNATKTPELNTKFQNILGSRLIHISTGGAKTSDEVLEWMRNNWNNIQVTDNYGATEVPGISQNGIVSANIQLKLVDVELGSGVAYRNSDKPWPRGEILVRSDAMTPGYWKLPEKTKEAFTTDGFFATGDIGMLEDGKILHIIDRKKNLTEMYVDGRSVWMATGKLESIIAQLPHIQQAYVHGDRMQSSLIAIVTLHAHFQDKFDTDEKVFESIVHCVKAHGYKQPYEIPAAVIVDRDPWTVQNGLLLGIGKPHKVNIRNHYDQKIRQQFLLLEKS